MGACTDYSMYQNLSLTRVGLAYQRRCRLSSRLVVAHCACTSGVESVPNATYFDSCSFTFGYVEDTDSYLRVTCLTQPTQQCKFVKYSFVS